MFFIFHFLKKVSSFLFSCISFKYVLLLASVSEFDCFLHSRCPVEMWCPDDIGPDSWDWVGPPAWRRTCFNSPEWGGGSSPVKTEPPQIVLLLLLSCICLHNSTCSSDVQLKTGAESPRSQTPGDSGPPRSPRALTGVSARGLKNGRSTSMRTECEKGREMRIKSPPQSHLSDTS